MTKFDPTKPVQTRGGNSVDILMHEGLCTKYGTTIVAIVTDSQDFQHVRTFCSDGQVAKSAQTPDDLINIPEKPVTIERWVNVYKDNKVGGLHGEKPRSDLIAGSIGGPRVACVPVTITFTPGEGLDDD